MQDERADGNDILPAGLAQPAIRALQAAGVTRLSPLTAFGEKEVARWHGIGPNALSKLREALKVKGLGFK